MDQFVERLPWRIAALAGLLVGAISWLWGTDPWVCLLRVGIAFAVFWLMGFALRAILQQEKTPPPANNDPTQESRGGRVDQTTPEMTVEDVRPDEGRERPERENENQR